MSDDRSRAGRWIAIAFGASAAASVGLTVVYFFGGQPQLEGTLLGIALGGLAVGLALWAANFMPKGPFVEGRKVAVEGEDRGEFERAERTFEAGAGDALGRRSFLVKMLGAALGALGLAALFPIRSLGERPGRAFFRTHWTEGARAVTPAGIPVRPDTLEIGGVLTVFPEGHEDAADSQTLLIRLGEDEYRALPGREDWAPEDVVGFSKICTHAGCPVGLYQQETNELFCPCHQSVFDVLRGAEPTAGPATRPLPQLPLGIDEDGYIVATGDFLEPVGPGFWDRDR